MGRNCGRSCTSGERYSPIPPQPITKPCPFFCRHLNLSQTVTLTIVTAGDAMERAKLLRRYIEVAQLLQSKYGNLFSFVATMQGLAAPQVCKNHFTLTLETDVISKPVEGSSGCVQTLPCSATSLELFLKV